MVAWECNQQVMILYIALSKLCLQIEMCHFVNEAVV